MAELQYLMHQETRNRFWWGKPQNEGSIQKIQSDNILITQHTRKTKSCNYQILEIDIPTDGYYERRIRAPNNYNNLIPNTTLRWLVRACEMTISCVESP